MVLSADQLQAIQQGHVVPITVDTTECVLIRKDVFEMVSQLNYDDSEFDIREAYPLMDAVARQEGWDNPSEDLYDDLVPRKSIGKLSSSQLQQIDSCLKVALDIP